MPVGVIVSFVVVFALILLAVSVALKFFDARRKKQVRLSRSTRKASSILTFPGPSRQVLVCSRDEGWVPR